MRTAKNLMKNRRNVRTDRRGGIEGLPLQLMIVLIVATMGTGIIVGWMGSIETPHALGDITVESGDIVLEERSGSMRFTHDGFVEVFVSDQDGNPLPGATVVLTGLGVETSDGTTAHTNTDNSGIATFEDLTIKMRGTTVGFVTVSVSMSGYGEDSSTRIAVVA